MNAGNIESTCAFGSMARESADALSDRDILIVSDNVERRRELIDIWEGKGWSVSAYSPSRLTRLIEAGSLFVQHLKHEGIVLKDENGWLSDNLDRAKPKKSYLDDANESVSLALPIERFESNLLVRDCLIVADLAYVALRNFGVCYLADKGLLSFDFQDIVTYLASDFELDEVETNVLRSMRTGKFCYRNQRTHPGLDLSVGRMRSILSKIFNHRPLVQVDNAIPVRTLAGGYTMMRDFEAMVVAKVGRSFSPEELSGNNLAEIWKWVRNPRNYSWNVRNASVDDFIVGKFELKETSDPTAVLDFCNAA